MAGMENCEEHVAAVLEAETEWGGREIVSEASVTAAVNEILSRQGDTDFGPHCLIVRWARDQAAFVKESIALFPKQLKGVRMDLIKVDEDKSLWLAVTLPPAIFAWPCGTISPMAATCRSTGPRIMPLAK